MRAPIQDALLVVLAGVLRPLVKLMLRTGVSCTQFIEVSKRVFVQVASEEYGLRGRLTNMSRVSAMTGISRKEVRRIREGGFPTRWTPDQESSPASTVLHYWHYDPDFIEHDGEPKNLPFEGRISFSSLVARYAGDIPPGAMRAELKQDGAVEETAEGLLAVRRRWFRPAYFDEDFVRRLGFSLQNLATTIVHNAALYQRPDFHKEMAARLGRFERIAWTERLTAEKAELFQNWVRTEGASFIENADHWIGQNETPVESWSAEVKTLGVGIYYFEEDIP